MNEPLSLGAIQILNILKSGPITFDSDDDDTLGCLQELLLAGRVKKIKGFKLVEEEGLSK